MVGPEIAVQILLVLGVIITAFVTLVRPQLRRMTQHRQFLESLKPGDRIVTGGGLVGKIVKCERGGLVEIELASSIRVQALRSSLEARIEG